MSFNGDIIPDDDFERELSLAISLTERAAFKKMFNDLDEAASQDISEVEIRSALSQVERQALKEQLIKLDPLEVVHRSDNITGSRGKVIGLNAKKILALAAAVTGIILLATLLLTDKPKNNEVVVNNNHATKPNTITNIQIPTITEQQEQTELLVPESFGFAKENKPVFHITVRNIRQQLDTLQKLATVAKDQQAGNIIDIIQTQVDSFKTIINTYTYEKLSNRIILNTGEKLNATDINVIGTEKGSTYINSGKYYYIIKETKKPVPLTRVTDEAVINELDKIVFQNLRG